MNGASENLKNDAKMPAILSNALGATNKKRRYDLPLDQSSGTYFLVLLVALMTFLALMAVSATMVLGSITQHWSSGLENKLTIEIPALKDNGSIREQSDIDSLAQDVSQILGQNEFIETFEVMDEDHINALVAPWLGDDVVLNDIPLPGLISVQLTQRDDDQLEELKQDLAAISDDIRLDTHESWLADILRLAWILQLSSFVVTIIIILTTITAVTGAIRSRMAEHRADIELLHLMGASDVYIAKQLQRHAFLLTRKGSVIGLICGLVLIALLAILNIKSDDGLMPGFSMSVWEILSLILLPISLSVIASVTARITVLRVLGRMP